MKENLPAPTERTLILAPRGRDGVHAKGILCDASIPCEICLHPAELVQAIEQGADLAVILEEATRSPDVEGLVHWVASQPPWSDFPFILLADHVDGLEGNPAAVRLTETLGSVTLLERPFHPNSLVNVVRAGLRGRQRQYECRRLNQELETRVEECTAEVAAANRQLLAQIEVREGVEETLRKMQRLDAVGQLTSGVAHDFNNLLTVVLGNIGFLERGLVAQGIDSSFAQRLRNMRRAAERGAKLTDQLLSFSRRQRLEPISLDLNEAVAGMHDLLHSTMGGSIHIETTLQRGLWPALVDPTQLELALLNLAINARDAMQVGGTLTVETENVTIGLPLFPEDPPAGDYVGICVSDTGSGMTEEIRARIFEPFFTTKEVGKGSGLGLSQVLGFAKQSGGGVRAVSRLGAGTSVHIYLPRAAAKPSKLAAIPVRTGAVDTFRGAVILLVDDDNAVREVTRALLIELGYLVLEAGSGGAALEVLEREPAIDLMIVDYAMPGMNGAEVARLAKVKRPRLPELFVTGFADRTALAGVSEGRIISKPFSDYELANKIQLALAEGASEKVIRLRHGSNSPHRGH